MNELQIEYINIKDLRQYDKNARKHKTPDVAAIANSIKEFGMCDPIGVWGKDNTIVEGHGRLQALKKLGYKKAPIIRLDHLSDEQRKAYGLAHNKTAELSNWDFDILDEEIKSIDIDMSDFGFDIDFDIQEYHEECDEKVQKQQENILNLWYGQYEGEGQYDIPILKPVYEIPKVTQWLEFNKAMLEKHPEDKGVHFFLHDYKFNAVWNNPTKYINKLKQFACVCTPDFSPYGDMPFATQLFNYYRRNWVGRYWQENGITVIPTVRASTDERSLDVYLDGYPKNSIVMISAMWTHTDEQIDYFKNKEYKMMMDKLHPKKVFVYGHPVDGIEGNIEYIEFSDIERLKSRGLI